MIPLANVYVDELSRYGQGIPLWCPEPPDGHLGVEIGDVGYIDEDGQFHRLFNATVEAEHPLNAGVVPQDFERLIIPPQCIAVKPNYFRAGPITSKGVRVNEMGVHGSAQVFDGVLVRYLLKVVVCTEVCLEWRMPDLITRFGVAGAKERC